MVGIAGEDGAEGGALRDEFLHQDVEEHGGNAAALKERIRADAGEPAPAAGLQIQGAGLGHHGPVRHGNGGQDGPGTGGNPAVGDEANIRVGDAPLMAGNLGAQDATPVFAAHPITHAVIIIIQGDVITADQNPLIRKSPAGGFKLGPGPVILQVQVHGDLPDGVVKAQGLQEPEAGAVLIHAGGVVMVMAGGAGNGPVQIQGIAAAADKAAFAGGAEGAFQGCEQHAAYAAAPAVPADKDAGQIAGGV